MFAFTPQIVYPGAEGEPAKTALTLQMLPHFFVAHPNVIAVLTYAEKRPKGAFERTLDFTIAFTNAFEVSAHPKPEHDAKTQ